MAVALEGSDCVDALVWTAVIEGTALIHIPAHLAILHQFESRVARTNCLPFLRRSALVVASSVVVLARVGALASPVVDMQTVSLATIAVIVSQGIYTEMSTPSILNLALIHVLARSVVVSTQ